MIQETGVSKLYKQEIKCELCKRIFGFAPYLRDAYQCLECHTRIENEHRATVAGKTKEIRWHAMAVNLQKCSITGIPFVVDPYTDAEEPELLENGDVPMVEFPFYKEDFEIIKALSAKMTAKDSSLNIEQWEIEALGNRLLSGMLKDFIDKGGNEYRLTDEFKAKAQGLITRETDPSKISIRSRDVRCPYCERMTTFIEGTGKGNCQFCLQLIKI